MNATSQSLTWLGTLGGYESRANGVSDDGSMVVGYAYNETGWQKRAFLWTAETGMMDLGTLGDSNSGARDISSDGSVIAGWSIDDTSFVKAVTWSAGGGIMNLGTLPGGHESEAYAISGNGSVVVGESWDGEGHILAFRWENGLMQSIGLSGTQYSRAHDVSADGSVVCGYLIDPETNFMHAFRWTADGGIQDLGTLGGDESEAFAVSGDGSVVTGYSETSFWSAGHAFRWTGEGGMEDLGTLGGIFSRAYDISEDGSVIVGISDRANSTQGAFIWTPEGMEDLDLLYSSLFGSESHTSFATAVSGDGRYIVGQGYNGTTQRLEGFLLDRGPMTAVKEKGPAASSPVLFQNAPNPFSTSTRIRFTIPEPGQVTIVIRSVTGEPVITLVDGHRSAGEHQLVWTGVNETGNPLSSGFYMCQLTVKGYPPARVMMVKK
ncbi:MAG: hypothetical protein Kow00127_01850 [Bacteroidales bacterium]